MGSQDNQTSSPLAVTSSPETVPEEELDGSPDCPSILIIEDNPVNLHILIAYVTKQGWSSETATNGLEAVQKFQAQPGKFIMVFIGTLPKKITVSTSPLFLLTPAPQHIPYLYLSV